MCGIAGALAPRGDAMPEVLRMHAAVAHRGPDGEGVERVGDAILAQRRLAIIDLSDNAAQPMWDANRQVCLVYNGEIYNYRALREECLARGAIFTSTSDTEVILQLYLLDGEAAFARLNGMFAFALVDTRSGESYLVRDVMGIKPLYWRPDGVLFASELSAFRGEVDREALQAYSQLDFVPSPLSMIRGVRKLPGGHLVHVSRDGVPTVRRYREEASGAPSADFDATIRDVVARQLIADVPVGVFLSGGIDSSIVARVATDLVGRVSTFSIAFDDPSFDETPYFETVAKAIGSDHHTERITEQTMESLLPDVPRVVGEPLADGSIFPTYFLARFARKHVQVALSGDGADELFGGYPTHRVSRWGRRIVPFRRPLLALARRLPVSHDNLSFDYRLKKLLEGAHRDPIVQNERWLGTFMAEELPSLLTGYDAAAQARFIDALHEPSRDATSELDAILRTDRRFYLQDGVLVKVDRATMASALEVRVPMLDDEIVRYARSLPDGEKLDKRHLRRWASAHFPPSIWKRKKKGFGAPLARWFRGPLRTFVRDALAPDALRRDGFYQPATIEALLDAHESGRSDERKRIFNVLMFTLWYRSLRA
ncbi:MAG: asparagine synthase (glutamine-hydrolyzing) [Acidobacteria bacterium]|nr:asparagine synthase (glutamine-hydrolyzing) [Acidobacteriota bacterium]